jgi:Tfp pilus assembly protein PilE
VEGVVHNPATHAGRAGLRVMKAAHAILARADAAYAPGFAAAATVAAFTATATPLGDQATDSCGTLSINQASQRLPAGCW